MVVDGKKISQNIVNLLKPRVLKLNRSGVYPRLAIILVGDNDASLTYIKKKQQAGEKIGVSVDVYKLDKNSSTAKIVRKVKAIQKKYLSGIIVQLPLPKKLDDSKILNAIRPDLDVDLMTYTNWGKLAMAENRLEPPTPAAILEVLKFHKINLTGKYVVVIGRGWLIGKPLTNLLMQQPVTITVCGKSTKNLPKFTKQADIIITAVGKHNLLRKNMVKTGVIIIDAGFSSVNGKIAGDVNVKEVEKIAKLVTPTPGGIGPITVAKLMANVVSNAEYLLKKRD